MKKLIGLFLLIAAVATATTTQVLVVVEGPGSVLAAQLRTDLANANTVVTIVTTGVPADIVTPGYSQIYDVRNDNTFSAAEQTQYLAWLNQAPGHALFLVGSGLNPARNALVNAFILSAGGGAINYSGTTYTGAETVNPPFTGPTPISTVQFYFCGEVTSHGTGIFMASHSGGTAGCSIWFAPGTLANATQGALGVVYDVEFISNFPYVNHPA